MGRSPNFERDASIARMFKRGSRAKQLSEQFEISTGRIYAILKKFGKYERIAEKRRNGPPLGLLQEYVEGKPYHLDYGDYLAKGGEPE
jgi:hypothetical protein